MDELNDPSNDNHASTSPQSGLGAKIWKQPNVICNLKNMFDKQWKIECGVKKLDVHALFNGVIDCKSSLKFK